METQSLLTAMLKREGELIDLKLKCKDKGELYWIKQALKHLRSCITNYKKMRSIVNHLEA